MEDLESRQLLTADITLYSLPSGTAPFQIVNAPDGNLWFVDRDGSIDMFNPATQATTKFPLPGGGGTTRGIAVGPDGNIWFTDDGTNAVGTIDLTTHAITEFPLTTPLANPEAIVAGPDGNLWFTEATAEEIGSINPAIHAISEFSLDTEVGGGADETGLTAGPDGNLWLTGTDGNQIGMFNLTTHALTEFPVPTNLDNTADITTGPDGNLWYTNEIGTIGTINPTTGVLTEFPLPAAPSGLFNHPAGITVGPDGNLWFANEAGDSVGMIDPTTDAITEFPVAATDLVPYTWAGPFEIVAGTGDTIWFTLPDSSQIGVINLSPPSTTSPSSPPGGTGPASPPVANPPTDPGTPTDPSGSGGGTGPASPPVANPPSDPGTPTDPSGSDGGAGPTSTTAAGTSSAPAASAGSSDAAGGAGAVVPPAVFVPPAPGLQFNFTIGLTRISVPDAAKRDGAISLILGSKPRRDVLSVATGKSRVAVSGLTLERFDHGAGFRIFADANARVAASRDPVEAALPHLLATEKILTAGRGKDKHVDGFRVVLAEAFAPAVARGMNGHSDAALPDAGRPGSVDLLVSYQTSLGVGSQDLYAEARVASTGQVVVIART